MRGGGGGQGRVKCYQQVGLKGRKETLEIFSIDCKADRNEAMHLSWLTLSIQHSDYESQAAD